jgi:predicted enzyme related to lactoylglutathione lyase
MHLNLLVLKSARMEELVLFYQMLGMRFEHHQHQRGPFHYAAEIGDMVFELYPLPENELVNISMRLGFAISNLDSTIEQLRNAGIKVVHEAKQTEWGYIGIVEDPDGRKVELKQLLR